MDQHLTWVGAKDTCVSKNEIEDGIFYSNYKEMKEEMTKYEKLEEIKYEDFRKEQDYMH